jgi:hypothetical protein
MRHLLSGVAIIAALAIAAPASAQRFGPGPGAETGTGPDVYPPGGFGPTSPMYNAQDVYPNPETAQTAPWGLTWPSATPPATAVPPNVQQPQ